MEEYKLFIGNVPFDCNEFEFKNTFKKIKGYINAELIQNNRGFGFVTVNNLEDLENIIEKNNIYIKDRKLRITRYKSNNFIKKGFYIRLENIPKNISVDDIKKEFENFTEIGKCFIDTVRETGEFKSTGIVEVLEESMYNSLLNLEELLINDYPITMKKYEYSKSQQIKKNLLTL
jgi:RNA recognition motif-containing protein